MSERLIQSLTRADFPEAKLLRARCVTPGCDEPDKERWDDSTAYLQGWFRNHVISTGHTVEICEVTPDAAPVPS